MYDNLKKTKKYILEAHKKSRSEFDLLSYPPKVKDGVKCKICVNECQIPVIQNTLFLKVLSMDIKI